MGKPVSETLDAGIGTSATSCIGGTDGDFELLGLAGKTGEDPVPE